MHKNEQSQASVQIVELKEMVVTNFKNLFGFKNILKIIQRFARYKNADLIWRHYLSYIYGMRQNRWEKEWFIEFGFSYE